MLRVVLAILCLVGASTATAAGQPDFAAEIEPILEQRCIQCHGDKQQLSGLRVDSREALLRGGQHGPSIRPGDSANSRLYQHVAGGVEPRMPFGSTLAAAEISALKRWIDAGAPWSTASEQAQSEKEWWAFRKPVRYESPDPTAHPVDAFLTARLAEEGTKPAPRADPRTLVRRAYLDLVGLLPPPEVVDAFVADPSQQAFARLVDRLLDSPRYGERWGRHWLDAVRYADSSGYEHDYDQPHAWRYRDYVIAAFNEDKPYDRFVKEQLAGDEIENPSFDSLIATGMLRVGPRVLFREKDNPQYRYTYLDDMIATTGRVFLGLTVDCARCHDHKFDAISQMDYYRTMAVFFPYIRYDFPLADAGTVARHEAETAAVNAKIAPLQERIKEIEKPYRALARERALEKFPEDIQIAVRTPEEERSPGQKLLAAQVQSTGYGSFDDLVSSEDAERISGLKAQIAALEEHLPEPLPMAMGIRDGDYRFAPNGLGDEVQPGKGDREDFSGIEGTWLPAKNYEPPSAHFLPNADYRTKGDVVQPGYIEALAGGLRFDPQRPEHRISSGRRLALAKWIASPNNPLTAPRDDQPHLDAPFRRGARLHRKQLRQHGHPPDPPAASRLARHRIRPGGLERQSDASPADDLRGLPDGLVSFRPARREVRPREQAALAVPAEASRGRDHPRHHSGRSGQSEFRSGRSRILPSDSRRGARVIPEGRMGNERARTGKLAAQRVRIREARLTLPAVRGVRPAQHERHLRAAHDHHGANASPHSAE